VEGALRGDSLRGRTFGGGEPPLLRSRRPQVLRVQEAVGGRQRRLEAASFAHQRDHLL
jgi:hypothetical protein